MNAAPAVEAPAGRRRFHWNPSPDDGSLRFLVRRGDLRHTRLSVDAAASPGGEPLAPGEVRLRIRRLAFSAGSLAGTAFGERPACGRLFAGDEPLWASPAVWGLAEVCESRSAGVAAGRLVQGLMPTGTHLVVRPGQVTLAGFVDDSSQRAALAVLGRQLWFCDADTPHDDALDAGSLLLHPAILAGSLIVDALATAGLLDGHQIVISSASSRTAWCTASCLTRHATGRPRRLVGLTAAGHHSFVHGLGLFDQVLSYDALAEADAGMPTVYLDFAGSSQLRQRVHGHWPTSLVRSWAVGATHAQAGDHLATTAWAGARSVPFVAAAHHRACLERYGAEALEQRVHAAWRTLAQDLRSRSRGAWAARDAQGVDALEETYHATLEGRADPHCGIALRW